VRPLWLDLLLTPMAAPETRWLRAMRLTLVAGAGLVAAGIVNLPLIGRTLGPVGTGMLAGLCIVLAALVAIYATVKVRADEEHLARITKGDR
jgi:hypothetical protein